VHVPQAVAAYIATATLTAASVLTAAQITALTYAAFAAGSIAVGNYQRRKAKRKAIEAYNASLEDRLVMTATVSGPRSRCYGRVRNVDGILFKATRGADKQFYTLVIALAGHEVDAIEGVYFGDDLVTLDANGWVQTAPYLQTNRPSSSAQAVLDGSGNLSYNVGSGATLVSASVVQQATGSVDEMSLQTSVSGAVVTASGGSPGANVTVSWQASTVQSYVRVRAFTGGSSQDLSTVLQPLFPDLITSAHRFAGIACLVVDLEFNPEVFPTGIPDISAVLRGARVLDPRTGNTAWTENPALIARDWALYSRGGGVSAADIGAASFNAAANACDVSQVFTTPGGTQTLPLYTCGIVCKLDDGDPWGSFQEMVEAMAGKAGWAGGQLRVVAGAYRAPVATITEDWVIDAQPVQVVPEPPADEAVNVYRANISDKAQKYVVVQAPELRAATYITADGRELPREITLGGVTDTIHAQHVCGVLMRDARNALTVVLTCNLRAFALELFDVVAVTLPRFGWSAKTFELVDWQFSMTGGVTLTLKETAAAIYQPDSSFAVLDVTPNTSLPDPGDVPAMGALTLTAGTDLLSDGTSLTRARVQWAAPADRSVSSSGGVEIQYWLAANALPAGDWIAAPMAPGNALETTLTGFNAGAHYLFRARFFNALGIHGEWSPQLLARMPARSGTGGSVLNSDPGIADELAWDRSHNAASASSYRLRSAAAGMIGTHYWGSKGTGSNQDVVVTDKRKIPADRARTYNLTTLAWAQTGNTRNSYLFVRMFTAAGVEVFGAATGWGGTFAGYVYGSAVTPQNQWVRVGADFGAGTSRPIPSNVAYMQVGYWMQYSAGPGASAVEQGFTDLILVDVTEARAAQAAAQAASQAANTAATNATSALATLQTMRSNGYIDAAEKPALIREWNAIAAEVAGVVAQASAYGLTALGNAYAAAHSALGSYLSALSPGWADTTSDTPITPAVDQAKWSDYYSAREALLRGVEVEAGKRAVWSSVTGSGRPQDGATVGAPAGTLVGGTLAQNVEANAANALSTANTASANATSALSALATMRSNGYLDAAEKPAVIREWNAIAAEVAGVVAQASAYGLTTLGNAYAAAHSALGSYLSSLSPGWADTTTDTPITPAVDQAKWSDYYAAREALLRAVATEAGKRALWPQVTGAGRPSDNATRDVTLVASGGLAIAGNSIEKTSSHGLWDAAAYSRESYAGGAFVSFAPVAANLRFMVGLNTDPTFSDSWQTLDYAIYVEVGVLFVAESGVLLGSLTTYAAGDSLAVTYDGATVRYLKNGVAFRSVAAVITQPLYLDSSFADVGARADRVVFGPMSAVRDIATQQLAPGAVTDAYFSTPADGSVSSTTVGAGRHTVATTAWTNTTTGPVVVEITLAFVHRRSQVDLGGGGAVKSFFGLQLTGSEAIDYKKVSPNVSELMPATIVANSTVPAGQTLTMTVFAEPTQQSGWVMSVFWAEVQFRWAAIKR
jgi:hypothetical protein